MLSMMPTCAVRNDICPPAPALQVGHLFYEIFDPVQFLSCTQYLCLLDPSPGLAMLLFHLVIIHPCHVCLFQNLSEEYTESSRLDDGGMPFVRYKDLVEEVDGVFGVRELERQPQCDVDASVHAAQVGKECHG